MCEPPCPYLYPGILERMSGKVCVSGGKVLNVNYRCDGTAGVMDAQHLSTLAVLTELWDYLPSTYRTEPNLFNSISGASYALFWHPPVLQTKHWYIYFF